MVFCEVTFCDRTAVTVICHFRACNLGDGWWCRQAATVPQGDQEVEGGLDGEEGEAGDKVGDWAVQVDLKTFRCWWYDTVRLELHILDNIL